MNVQELIAQLSKLPPKTVVGVASLSPKVSQTLHVESLDFIFGNEFRPDSVVIVPKAP